MDQPAIGSAPCSRRDRFGDDVGGRLVRRVDHLCAGVLVLAVAGERDGDHLAARFAALEDHAGIFDRQPRADVAVDPFDLGVLMGDAAFGDEVEDVAAPVLHRDVLNLRALHGDQLDHRRVERGGLKFRRGAPFHIHQLRAFIGDDERALELPEVLGVDAEIRLQRMLHLHPRGNIDERAAAEHRGVERAEFVVARGNHFPEPFAKNLRVFDERLGGPGEDHALVADGFLNIGIDGLGVKLRLHTGEEFALLLRDAEPLEGLLHVLGHVVPGARGPLAVREIVADFVELQRLQILARPMGRERFALKNIERLETEFANPVRLVFYVGNVVYGVAREPVSRVESVMLGIREIADAPVQIQVCCGF